jgi:hypothetical protein
MTDLAHGVHPKPGPSRRKNRRAIILVVCAAFALTVFVCCYAVTVVAAAVLNGIDAVFIGLGAAIGVFISWGIMILVVAVLPLFMELLSLLSAGQLIPFVSRLFHLVGSS